MPSERAVSQVIDLRVRRRGVSRFHAVESEGCQFFINRAGRIAGRMGQDRDAAGLANEPDRIGQCREPFWREAFRDCRQMFGERRML